MREEAPVTPAQYRIEVLRLDSAQLLEEWKWLLPDAQTVVELNLFGDMLVSRPDGQLALIDVSLGTATPVDEQVPAPDWLRIPLVDQLEAAGLRLGKEQCYSHRLPPILGGSWDPDNFEAIDTYVHLSLSGQIHQQVKDLPDGTPIGGFTFKGPPSASPLVRALAGLGKCWPLAQALACGVVVLILVLQFG
jgi:hypothetical protein